MPGSTATPSEITGALAKPCTDLAEPLFRNEQFRRLQPLELGYERRVATAFEHRETPGTEVQPREAKPFTGWQHGGDQSLATLIEQRGIGDRARRDDANDGALYGPLTLGGVADLFADRDRFAFAHEPREIVLGAVIGHTRHRDRRASGLATRGEGDVEQLRRTLGVVEEELVEITHPIEQQHVGVLRLQSKVLLHHGRVFGGHRAIIVHAILPLHGTRTRHPTARSPPRSTDPAITRR